MSVELFCVHCTTCHARLKVRDQAAIGQILACPKCGSMVQVVPPPGWQPSAEPNAAEPAPADALPMPPAPAEASPQAPANDLPAPPEPVPAPGWVSPAELWWRQLVVWGTAPIAAAVIGAAVWLGLTRSDGKGEPPAADRLAEPPSSAVADVQPPPVAPPLVDAASVPDRVDPRWVLHDARALISLPMQVLQRQEAAQSIIALWATQWNAAVAPLYDSFGLQPQDVRRLTWSSRSPTELLDGGVVVIALARPVDPSAWPPQSVAVDLPLGSAECRRLTSSAWPHPLAVVDPWTIVTGPADLLGSLAAELDHPPPADDQPPLDRLLALVSAEHRLLAAFDLPSVRPAAARPFSVFLDAWSEARQSWRVLVDVPLAAALSVDFGQSLTVQLALECESGTAADEVAAAAGQMLAAVQTALDREVEQIDADLKSGAITAAAAEKWQFLVERARRAAQSRKVERVERAALVQTQWDGDVAPIVAAALASRPTVEARRRALAGQTDRRRQEQLFEGLSACERAEGALPAGAAGSSLLPPEGRLSWIAALLPYTGHLDWHRELNPRQSWNAPANLPVTRRPLAPVTNPAVDTTHTPAGFPVTHYVGLAGVGADAAELEPTHPRAGVFGHQRRTRRDQIPDGASNTIAVVGVERQLGPWAQGGPASVRPFTAQPYVNGPDGFGSGQPDGMLVGMADGSVRFISRDVDPRVLEMLATAAGGEPLSPPAAAIVAPAPQLPGQPAAAGPPQPQPPVEPPPLQPPAAVAVVPQVDVDARLSDPLDEIQFQQIPLGQLVDLLGQLSTLQISFDADALTAAGVRVDDPVSVDLRQTTVGEVLETALAQRGLSMLLVHNQVIITSDQAGRRRLETLVHTVDDLTGGSLPAAAELADMLRLLIEPDSWDTAGGRGTIDAAAPALQIKQNALVQRRVGELLDRLRLARGLPPRGPRAAGLSLATRRSQAQARLDTPVTLNFREPAPLRRIVEQLHAATGVNLLVDALALSAEGLLPDADATLVVHQRPLGEALQELLAPLGLTCLIVGPRTLEITTQRAADGRFDVEFHSLAPLVTPQSSPEDLIAALKEEVAPQRWLEPHRAAAMYYDAASRYLIVRQTQAVQLELQQLLDAWRSQPAEGAR